jgi:hypothetical protein
MSELMTVSDVARELSDQFKEVIQPRVITDLFYKRLLDDNRCQVLGGRRLIPRDYLAEIRRILTEKGLIARKS